MSVTPKTPKQKQSALFSFYIRRARDDKIVTQVEIKNKSSAYGVLLGMIGRCRDRVNYYVDFSEGIAAGVIDTDELSQRMK